MAIRIIGLIDKYNYYQPTQQILRAGPCNDLYSQRNFELTLWKTLRYVSESVESKNDVVSLGYSEA